MNPKSPIAPSSLLFLSFFLLFTSATCFNITKLFNTYPDFSTFNSYLTQTQLSAEINKRQTITVLAVANSAIGQLSGKSIDDIRKIMSLHVVLDYFDASKLQKLSNKTALLTTLFQSSGQALGQQGFINVTDLSSGEIALGSAVKGSSLDAKLIKLVAAQPYNISVLQISAVIIPEGIVSSSNNNTKSPPPSVAPVAAPKKSPTVSPAPSKASPAKAPAPSDESSAPAPSADAPSADAPSVDAPSADAPTADAPSDGPAVADSPLGSPPSPSVADGPTADEAHAPSAKGSSTRVTMGLFVGVFMVVVSSWVTI